MSITSLPFGSSYSGLYDLLYSDKDYAEECQFVCELFEKYSTSGNSKDVLDFGCGTGSHAVEFSKRGFSVLGVDNSPAMLALAKEKAGREGAGALFQPTPPQGKQFDLIVSLFAVVNYLDGEESLLACLRYFSGMLKPTGLLIIETWNGDVVPLQYEKEKTKRVDFDGGQIERRTTVMLNAEQRRLEINFEVFQDPGRKYLFSESHWMHYYSRKKIERLFHQAGLVVECVCPAFQRRSLENNDFNILYALKTK